MGTVVRDLGMRPENLRVSVRNDDADDGSDGLMTPEPEEFAGLRPRIATCGAATSSQGERVFRP